MSPKGSVVLPLGLFRLVRIAIPLGMGLLLTLAPPTGWAFTFSPGRRAYEKGDYQAAAEHFRKEQESSPKDMDSAYSLGNALYRLGRYDEASAAFEGSLGEKKDFEAGWYNLGNSYFRQDRYKDAIEAYGKALELDPKDEDAKFNLDLARKKLKKDPKADKSGKGKKPPQGGKDQKQDQESSRKEKQPRPEEGAKDRSKGKAPGQGDQGKGQQEAEKRKSRQEDQQRQENAKKQLGLNDRQIQDLMDQMQRWEADTQRYFSKDPKRERRQQQEDPWGHLPPEQRKFFQQYFGQNGKKDPGPAEDW